MWSDHQTLRDEATLCQWGAPFHPCLQVLCLGINDKLSVACGTQSELSVLGCLATVQAVEQGQVTHFNPMPEPPIPC